MEIDVAEEKDEMKLPQIEKIIQNLVSNADIIFKSQQRGETDLDDKEKTAIAYEIYEKSKINFLLKFGKYLQVEDYQYFEKFTRIDNEPLDYEDIRLLLIDLKAATKNKQIHVKNRRFEALQQMIKEDSYFSETEMMKRDPLLYEQLIGQYMSEEEKHERDRYQNIEDVGLVKILMEGIERNDAESSRKLQQEQEDQQMEANDEDDTDDEEIITPSTSRWGEFESDKSKTQIQKARQKSRYKTRQTITASERVILKEEFVTTMYQNFLDGKDRDFFDYSLVDDNSSYDNCDEMDQDSEDKYFDSEDPDDCYDHQTVVNGNGNREDSSSSSEDELDAYMKTLKQCHHPAVNDLVRNFHKTL